MNEKKVESANLYGKDDIKIEDDKIIVRTRALANLLDVSDRNFTDWKREGLTQYKRGWWDLKNVLKWRGNIYNADTEETKAVDLQQKKLEAEVAFKQAQAELTKMKNDIAGGKYVERDLVEIELARFFLVFKKSALHIPRKLAGHLSGHVDPVESRKLEAQMAEIIIDALEQMSVDGVYDAKGKK